VKKFIAVVTAIAAFGFVNTASAADMPTKAPMAAPLAVAYNWTGLYVGVQGGYGWGNSVQFFTAGAGGSTARFNTNGWVGGGTLGYNWQFQQWVLGLETDFSGSHINGSTISTGTYGCGTGCSTNVNAFGTLRGRLGMAFNNVLIYGTGGLAYASIQSGLNGGSATNWRTGWTAGAGAEYGITRNWSAKLEWIYVNISSYQWTNATNVNFACTGLNCSTDAKFSVLRLGVNYRF
jgi:outer membrane immunogenic protein